MRRRHAVNAAAAIRSGLRRRRKPLIAGAAVIAFAAALLAWTRGSPQHPVTLPHPTPTATPAAPATRSSTRSAAPSGAASRGTGDAGRADASVGLPNLPRFTDAALAGAPQHSVLLTVSSDRAILRVGYEVKGPHRTAHTAADVRSPYRVLTVGRGYGAMAALGAQAAPGASYLTCTITVDGLRRSSRTVHGGWKVAVCLG